MQARSDNSNNSDQNGWSSYTISDSNRRILEEQDRYLDQMSEMLGEINNLMADRSHRLDALVEQSDELTAEAVIPVKIAQGEMQFAPSRLPTISYDLLFEKFDQQFTKFLKQNAGLYNEKKGFFAAVVSYITGSENTLAIKQLKEGF